MATYCGDDHNGYWLHRQDQQNYNHQIICQLLKSIKFDIFPIKFYSIRCVRMYIRYIATYCHKIVSHNQNIFVYKGNMNTI